MSIADQITRIKNNIAASYAECSAKGATLPTTENSENLPNTIASITAGGGGGDSVEYTNITDGKIIKGSKVWLNETATTTEKSNIIPQSQYADIFIQTSNTNVVISGSARFTLEDNQYIQASLPQNLSMNKLFIDKNGILAAANRVYNIENNMVYTAANYECYAGNGYTTYSSQVCKINLESLAIETTYEVQYSNSEAIKAGWSFEDGYIIGSYAYMGTVRVWKLNNEGTRFNIVGSIYDTNALTCIGQFTEQKIGWALKGNDFRNLNLGAYRYSRTGDAVTVEEIPATEFPEDMQSMFTEQPNYIFWNEQTLTMTATWIVNNRVLIFKYENGQWVNKSPIITFEGEIGYVSCDATTTKIIANYSTTTSSPVVYDGNEKSGGYYGVPYLYSNKSSITGKAEEDCENNAKNTASTVLFGGVVTPPTPTPDPTTMELQLWRFNKPIESHHLFSTHSEIFDAEVDYPEDYRLIPTSVGNYPLLYRSEDGYVYSYNGASDNTNTVTWKKLYNWGTNTQPKSIYYYGNNGGKIAAVNTNKVNADWSVLVQDINDINNVKKFKISGNYKLTYIESGYTYINGVTTPTIVACGTSSMAGFYISTDDGENWKSCKIGDKWDSWNQGMGKMISQVLFSKGTIFVLFGANYEEIYKSSDCGETWQKVEYDNKLGVYTSNYQWQGNMTIKDGYNEYLFFPASTFTFGYLWDGSNFQKISFNNITYSGYAAVSIPQLYSALIYRNGLYKIIQLDDQGFHEISSFTVWKGTPKTVLPPVCIDYETISTLINMGADVEINQVRFARTYTKKFPPEVGDKTATFATKQDEFWTDEITSYTDGLITTSTYGDDYKYQREPRGDVTLG